MIELGKRVRDRITGFKGIATARTEWLYKTAQVCVEAEDRINEVPVVAQWFDEARIEEVQPEQPSMVPHFGAVSLDSDYWRSMRAGKGKSE